MQVSNFMRGWIDAILYCVTNNEPDGQALDTHVRSYYHGFDTAIKAMPAICYELVIEGKLANE